MRHAVFGRKLGRDTNSRKALLKNLSGALIINESVTTTLAKTKFVKPYVEKMVTLAKVSKLGSRRVLASSLPKAAFKKLTEEIAPGFQNRAGGYTRIIKIASRRGDAAAMARIEFIAWDKPKTLQAKPKKLESKKERVERKIKKTAKPKKPLKKETTKKAVKKAKI